MFVSHEYILSLFRPFPNLLMHGLVQFTPIHVQLQNRIEFLQISLARLHISGKDHIVLMPEIDALLYIAYTTKYIYT